MTEQAKTSEGAVEVEEAFRRRKIRTGVVLRAKMEKTIIVVVERRVKAPKYMKYVTQKKKYAAHDEMGCQEGDRVRIKETRPMSKTKRWRVIEKLAPHQA